MKRFRVWEGVIKKSYEEFATVALAIKYLRKSKKLDEANSGMEERFDGEWDEWLDEDAQTIHDHIYMYGAKSPYMKEKKVEYDDNANFELDDEDDEDLDDEIDDEEEEDVDDDDEMENRFMNAIGANKGAEVDVEENFAEDFDDEEEEEDFDEDDDDEKDKG